MELLEAVKDKCYITTDDLKTLQRLTRIVEDSTIKIARLIGVADDFDFSAAGEERELLLNYCWYAWNDCENEFKDNYLDDILAIRQKYEVLYYAEQETQEP